MSSPQADMQGNGGAWNLIEVLKRAESRLQLERSLQPDRAGSKSLGSYIKAIGPGIFQDAMLSVEAHIASKMQVDAVFGDLQVLRGHLANALAKRKPSRSGTSAAVQDAVNSGEVAAIYILVADVRRLLLEAAAFGAFLWQAEDKALELSTPTLTKQSRLSDFGVQADSDGNPALVMDWAEKRSWMERAGRQYARQTALVVESGLSVATGLVVSLFLGANQLDQLALAFWPLCLRFFPVALCFAAGTIKIVGQLRLGLVAIASTILLARRYSPEQWVAISAVTVFCMLFVQVKGQGRKRRGKEWKWEGLSQLLGWVCMNVVGGTLAEKTYKSSDVPYYVQKVAQDMGHLATSLVMLFLVVPHFNPSEEAMDSAMQAEKQSPETCGFDVDEWNEGKDKALALPFDSHIMDFGPQNTLVRKITRDQLAGNRGKAILCKKRFGFPV
eukprot:symbB.v1.2.036601.t1/scaffold5201.1/size46531/3